MAVEWRLQQALEEAGIPNPSRLKAALEETLGITISRAALGKLMGETPASLRMETAQILCTLLQRPLEAYLIVTPEPVIKTEGGLIQPYGKKTVVNPSFMSDPGQFF
ncbi:MAG: hypothetical protein AB7P76_12485 [Candidatus Melainabacteria bacterium]